ncbi:MAG: relaxase/mobilization nuclease domain-containing protein [Acidobacteria bacterium]|nr:relaxase/mobilization nuclease domain-containing protein [Acidobacteriota bacterium]
MIIKSMARKSISFSQLLSYIDRPQETTAPLLHNFGGHSSSEQIRREFLHNAHLLPPRKNGNVLYHEVLSFAPQDREQLNPGALLDLTRRYLELRAPYALAYGRAHLDTANPHVHLVISANNVGSAKRLRLSKQSFRRVQQALERYQRERYPELGHSLAQEPRARKKERETRAEQERRRRGESTPCRKDVVRGVVLQELAASWSGPELYQRLLRHGLRLYRRGQTVGVADAQSGRRFRLKTLEVAKAFDDARRSWQLNPQQVTPSPDRSRGPPGQDERAPERGR